MDPASPLPGHVTSVLTWAAEGTAGEVAALGLVGDLSWSTVEMQVGGDPAGLNGHQVSTDTCNTTLHQSDWNNSEMIHLQVYVVLMWWEEESADMKRLTDGKEAELWLEICYPCSAHSFRIIKTFWLKTQGKLSGRKKCRSKTSELPRYELLLSSWLGGKPEAHFETEFRGGAERLHGNFSSALVFQQNRHWEVLNWCGRLFLTWRQTEGLFRLDGGSDSELSLGFPGINAPPDHFH